MITIKYQIDEEKVDSNNFTDKQVKDFFSKIKTTIMDKLPEMKCKNHGKEPKIIIEGKDLNNLSYEITGCCENVKKEILEKLI